ncbi:MAG TPA: mechanosensitive ion channel domain-containing protein [Candidatus Aquilonibacter sp.]|nr:mechanosensitive ion channel domain-containing protein [Candidatus Aquilonibacter sp.]
MTSTRRCFQHILRLSCMPFLLSIAMSAQAGPQGNQTPAVAPVEVDHKSLFEVQGVLSFPAHARAAAISRRINDLSKDITFKPDSLTTADSGSTTDILANDLVVMSVTDQDAKAIGQSRETVAKDYADRIRNALLTMRREYSLKSILLGILYAIVATSVLYFLFRALSILFAKLYRTIESSRRIRSIKIQRFELLAAHRITEIMTGVTRLLRLAISILALYFYASLVLSFFPWTRGYAEILLSYVLSPLQMVWQGIVSYLPNVFFIGVIGLVSFYAIKFIKIIFTELERQTITVSGFYPEWAEPTYKIVRFLVFALTLIVLFPYLPGSRSPAFRGVSIFLGVLVSLGSTSAVANIVAGVILTYMRPFKTGDRVKIADTVGDIVEKNLLVTRVRTIKNVEITIANSMVLGSHIVNFSCSAQQEGLILHTTVTIGYDAPWRVVHKLLIDAALLTEHVLQEPKPFIFQTALDDFYVHYELNAFTNQPGLMAGIYSDLHQNIQDKFYEAGVEIMSPHFSSVRDGNQVAIPPEYRPKGYSAPRFRLGIFEDPAG